MNLNFVRPPTAGPGADDFRGPARPMTWLGEVVCIGDKTIRFVNVCSLRPIIVLRFFFSVVSYDLTVDSLSTIKTAAKE